MGLTVYIFRCLSHISCQLGFLERTHEVESNEGGRHIAGWLTKEPNSFFRQYENIFQGVLVNFREMLHSVKCMGFDTLASSGELLFICQKNLEFAPLFTFQVAILGLFKGPMRCNQMKEDNVLRICKPSNQIHFQIVQIEILEIVGKFQRNASFC